MRIKDSFIILTCCLAAGLLDGCQVLEPSQIRQSQTDKKIDISKLSDQDYRDWAPGLGYLRAHQDLQSPPVRLGGALRVTVKSAPGGVVRMILPGPRELDPNVFGLPGLPSSWSGTPGEFGVPPGWRDEQDGHYTVTNRPTAFSNLWRPVLEGVFALEATDITLSDAARTKDTVKFEARWKDNYGDIYIVKCREVLPHGTEFPVFGGVVTNHLIHGFTRIDNPLGPTVFAYVAFWGVGELSKNGKVLDRPVIVHGMLTENVRIREYELAQDHEVDAGGQQFHLLIPHYKPSLSGTGLRPEPVNTGFKLPNGRTMPFWYVIFDGVRVSTERLQD